MGISLARVRWRFLAGVVLLLSLAALGVAMAGYNLWGWYHLRAARSAVEHYHNQEAQQHLLFCLKMRSKDPEVFLLAARTARRLGEFEHAEEFLNQYHALVPKSDDNLILERGLLRCERGEVDSFTKFCQTLVEKNLPDAPLALEALIRGYVRMYRLEEAALPLHIWLERDPDNVQAHMMQGLIYEYREAPREAAAAYRHVLQQDPEHNEARLRLCTLLMDLGQSGDAVPHLEYLHQQLPENLQVLVALARCRDFQGQQGEAENLLDKALEREPNHPQALAERGKLALRAGQFPEAEEWLRKATAFDPGDYQLHYQLYLCLERAGKPDEARQEQQRLTRIETDMKRIQEIVSVKMQQDPHNADLHYEAAMIALHAGSPKEGLRWLESALKENPKHIPTHKALADYYRNMGQFGRAARHEQLSRPPERPSPENTLQETVKP